MKKIAVLQGDGIGPEIISSALEVLDTVSKKFNINFEVTKYDFGGQAIDKTGEPLPKETLEGCLKSDAILLGAIGDPKFDNALVRPEMGLLEIRKKLNLYANVRPVKVFDSLVEKSPLKKEIVKGTDFVIVRELISGIYFGERSKSEKEARDTCYYSKEEIERIAKLGFELAQNRRNLLTSVDKQNVLDTSKLWRETVNEVSKNFSNVELEHQLVDSMAMMIISKPSQYDVVITENMFGDILSDEASMISGSIGLMPSSSISLDGPNLYEPIHGSAPDIKGQNIANPIGTILSLSMLLQDLGETKVSKNIEEVVENVINSGHLTKDLGGSESTTSITKKIIEGINDKNDF